MIEDHEKIVKLLNEVEKNINQDMILIHMIKVFNDFKWKLEKHIFIEEKAIFTSYEPENIAKDFAMIPELIKEHNIILNKLIVTKKEIKKKRTSNFQEFKDMLIKHKNFEEEKVYPKLDQVLDESEKKIIIKRINEIL